MKKFNLIGLMVVAFLLLAGIQNAFAYTITIESEKNYTDSLGNSKREVSGTIAFDSDYPCAADTARCGEYIPGTILGMSQIERMDVDAITVGQGKINTWQFFRTGVTAGDGNTSNVLRLYRINRSEAVSGIQGGLTTVPTYDLSSFTAVPFLAIGDV